MDGRAQHSMRWGKGILPLDTTTYINMLHRFAISLSRFCHAVRPVEITTPPPELQPSKQYLNLHAFVTSHSLLS